MDLPGLPGYRGELGSPGDPGTNCIFFHLACVAILHKLHIYKFNLGVFVCRTKGIVRRIGRKG